MANIIRDYSIYVFATVVGILVIGIYVTVTNPKQIIVEKEQTFLNTTTEASIYDKLTPKEQTVIKQLVFAYCSFRYHRDSCLHHYITCGHSCKGLVSPKTLARMKRDYKLLTKYRVPASTSKN